jgi:hypothetical protein
MSYSIVKNGHQYIRLLTNILNDNALITDPKQLFQFIELSEHKGKITGWQINNKEIQFTTADIIDCDESALLNGDRYIIKYFSYHFNPSNSSSLCSYRIDSEQGDLHFNPDLSLIHYYGDHISPDQLDLNINNFNCVLAIQLALMYITKCIYPAEPQAKEYNSALDGIRRKLE